MYESYKPHPLLAQIPLTVSPFISLPTATTLPYTYKSVPSTLPPSVALGPNSSEKARYVISSGRGHVVHPGNVLASCEALEKDMNKIREGSLATIKDWEESIKQRDLAEKRRIAPGWLDREEKLLQPVKISRPASEAHTSPQLSQQLSPGENEETNPDTVSTSEGEALVRAFGNLE
ncbi:conserved hypothetical protein [Histoplasma capsulatum G186AR]|uniref:Uncharacterized protein n=2 Tax=Ajellomyces capsulatus TaxID=5037 RepID=C0NTY5_AJECG|nr:uncharacterized protein HCBG_06615 [Histoplasma capsulatum G186AR]EEH05496.1 conserved hypothetical protein [Histoplasma capsulatum G186AR]KAG5305134.1 hypothetical protein I7I52_03694 [Histoplasma capsulatum]QSS76094.1 hypothetical protein I7I50_05433 [Histoplasma capsulatum G186AR]